MGEMCGNGEKCHGDALNSPDLRWMCSFYCQTGNWEQKAALSRDIHGQRPEPLLRDQLHNPLSTQEHMQIPTRLKHATYGFDREESDRRPTDSPGFSPWPPGLHGNVNFPLTLTGRPPDPNNGLIESGQCPLLHGGQGSQCSLHCYPSHHNLLLCLTSAMFALWLHGAWGRDINPAGYCSTWWSDLYPTCLGCFLKE